MNKNDNQNSNNDLSNQGTSYDGDSEHSASSKSRTLHLYSQTSIKLNKSIRVLDDTDNVNSVIEHVLQKCNEHITTNESNNAGPSKQNDKQISILHPKQFDSIASSDHMFSETLLLRERLPRTSNIIRPLSRMSDTAFKCFILQNFPSAIDLRKKSSSAWNDLLQSKNIYKPTNDNSTQFDLPSINENEVSSSIFSRHAINTTSQEIQITPSLVPPRPIRGNPPLPGAPPSYSAVMRIGDESPTRSFGRRLGNHIEPSPPFISPSPPPSYAEAQGRYYRPIIIDSELIWGPDPMATVCQRCGAHIITTTTSQRSNLTHFAAVALCLCGCWPCCLLPYCMNSCKNTYHYCPNCSTYLGMYRPW